jgi:hypothetical protein
MEFARCARRQSSAAASRGPGGHRLVRGRGGGHQLGLPQIEHLCSEKLRLRSSLYTVSERRVTGAYVGNRNPVWSVTITAASHRQGRGHSYFYDLSSGVWP